MTDSLSTHIVVVTVEGEARETVLEHLTGLDGHIVAVDAAAGDFDAAFHPAPSAVVVVASSRRELTSFTTRVKGLANSPVLAVISPELFDLAVPRTGIDDFCAVSASSAELNTRVRRLVKTNPESGDIIRRGDLTIDVEMCEVALGGHLVELTFKEYELLKFLASYPGRVHSRDVLLDRVWGYDYYGGDRTVDVHIRRLRSKIEDANHTFIDTVRNVGYRFRRES
ncbi:winged helix-turn-helix domain-containing protein [Chloroflexota bacterium]